MIKRDSLYCVGFPDPFTYMDLGRKKRQQMDFRTLGHNLSLKRAQTVASTNPGSVIVVQQMPKHHDSSLKDMVCLSLCAAEYREALKYDRLAKYLLKQKKFTMLTKVMLLTDPCYDKDAFINHNAALLTVLPGTWYAAVSTAPDPIFANRPMQTNLLLAHESRRPFLDCVSEKNPRLPGERRVSRAGVGVDSGQAGAFDLASYPKDGIRNKESSDSPSFYFWTARKSGPGAYGVTSATAIGDGHYPVYAVYENKTVVAVRIKFA